MFSIGGHILHIHEKRENPYENPRKSEKIRYIQYKCRSTEQNCYSFGSGVEVDYLSDILLGIFDRVTVWTKIAQFVAKNGPF